MSGYSNNSPDAGRMIPAYVGTPAIDTELRSFMLRVFNTMAGGLALTGVVAYVAAASGAYAAVAGTPLFRLVMLPRSQTRRMPPRSRISAKPRSTSSARA